ncbi:uncharacterized protein LOC125235535 [Leguminivora glycinivorella]|uniref:uncharacterized protein LOC125235535 n=1 Tax=Leguminivora glycinivorella TaxID=1035111 RepID=UPI00200F2A7B|nr:uncharacterized protein LOC125235535 [Leguminivora glycinivorella]XP_047998082.1 uncharacterized protein LOC125235535 [Leguminivora glycinivorella]XP_047998083.1 uncharacterized protein LOC125235535 [Leguminivora glycinivorella]
MSQTLVIVGVLAVVATVQCVFFHPPIGESRYDSDYSHRVVDYRRSDDHQAQYGNNRRWGWGSLKMMFKSGDPKLAEVDSDSSDSSRRSSDQRRKREAIFDSRYPQFRGTFSI